MKFPFKVTRQRESPTLSAFTLLELLIVIAIVAVLSTLLFAGFSTLIEKSHTVSCLSNQRQLGVLLHQYAGDNGNRFPYFASSTQRNWSRDLTVYSAGSDNPPKVLMHNGYSYPALPILFCPAHKSPKILRGMVTATDYAVNTWAFWDGSNTTPRQAPMLSSFASQSRTLLLIDGADPPKGNNSASSTVPNIETLGMGAPYVGPVHQGRANLLFLDGHAETRSFPEGTRDVEYHRDPRIGEVLR